MKIWGDSRENMFDMYGDSCEKNLEILAVVESDLLRLWSRRIVHRRMRVWVCLRLEILTHVRTYVLQVLGNGHGGARGGGAHCRCRAPTGSDHQHEVVLTR